MDIKKILPGEDLTDALWVREAVFTKEQGFLQPDEDEFDILADHVLIYDAGRPVATGRCYADPEHPQKFHVGRICVLKEMRGRDLGRILMEQLEKISQSRSANLLVLGAQLYAVPFYERCGFAATGNRYFDEHCEHEMMEKALG